MENALLLLLSRFLLCLLASLFVFFFSGGNIWPAWQVR